MVTTSSALRHAIRHPETATAMLSQQVQVKCQVEENTLDIKNQLTRVVHSLTSQFHNMNTAINKIALQIIIRSRRRQVVNDIFAGLVGKDKRIQNVGIGNNLADIFSDSWEEPVSQYEYSNKQNSSIDNYKIQKKTSY